MERKDTYIKGRGAQINPANRFDNYVYDENPIDWEQEESANINTSYIEAVSYTHLTLPTICSV